MTPKDDQLTYAAALQVHPEDCISCYACVRVCPARAIEVKANAAAVRIIPERCTACGSCYEICPTEAISYPSDLEQVVGILTREEPVAFLVDPSISAEFPDINDYRSFIGMIKALGVHYVCDVSFGADLVSGEYRRLFEAFKGKYFISSKCPAVFRHVMKYYPALTDNLAPIVTPESAMARVVRKKYGNGVRVISVSPCLASRFDPADPSAGSQINGYLTFRELRLLFDRFQIKEGQVEYQEFDPPFGRKGSLFPLTAGLMQSAGDAEDLLASNFHSASGRSNMLDAIDEFNQSNEIRKHLDLFYCEGCIMGPGMTQGGRKFMRQTLVKDYTRKRLQMTNEEEWLKHMHTFADTDLSRTFLRDDQTLQSPSDEEIEQVLLTIGKTSGDNVERGCSACGYKSCHDFASAVVLGLAKTDMCQTFGSKNRREYIHSLQTANEKLARTKEALEESEQSAREEKMRVQAFSDTVSAVLQRIPSGVIIAGKDLRIVQANQVMVKLLGEDAADIHQVIPGLAGADLKKLIPPNILQLFHYCINGNEEVLNKDVMLQQKILNLSVFPIQKETTYGAIFRDMASPEVQKEEVVKRVTETIDRNLEMVQKIGFLLGEGAAETEKMLHSIIESFQSGKNT